MSKLEIGSPVFKGKSLTAEEIEKAIPIKKFPAFLFAKNHMPRNCSFPELQDKGGAGLYLTNPNLDEKDSVREVVVRNYPQLVRAVSSIEQICELNSYELGITLDTEAPPAPEPTEEEKAAADALKAEEERVAAAAIKAQAEAEEQAAKLEAEAKAKAEADAKAAEEAEAKAKADAEAAANQSKAGK